MSEIIKTYNFGRPPAGTDVHSSKGPAPVPTLSLSRAANLFFSGKAIETRGGGNVLKKQRRARQPSSAKAIAGTKPRSP